MEFMTADTGFETARDNSARMQAEIEAMAEKASKGNRIALYNLCEMLAGGALFRTKYITGSETAAKDVSRDILLRVCDDIKNLHEPEAFRAWLGGITINEARRHISKSSRRAAAASIDQLPEGQAGIRDAREIVMEAASGLPLRQREAVMLHYYDDLEVPEVAKAMKTPQQIVSRYLSLAQKKIEIELKKHQYAPDDWAYALLPLGAALSEALHAAAAGFAPSDPGWAHGALVQCQQQILSSINPAGGTAGSVAARMPFAAIAGALTSIIIAAVLALGIAFGDKAPQEPGAGQAQAHTTEGRIVFTGGETCMGTGRMNPKYAEPRIEGAEDELKIHKWWVTPAGRDTVLYEGEAGEIDDVLLMLSESGLDGEYNMVFRFEDKLGVVYRLSSNFYIQQPY